MPSSYPKLPKDVWLIIIDYLDDVLDKISFLATDIVKLDLSSTQVQNRILNIPPIPERYIEMALGLEGEWYKCTWCDCALKAKSKTRHIQKCNVNTIISYDCCPFMCHEYSRYNRFRFKNIMYEPVRNLLPCPFRKDFVCRVCRSMKFKEFKGIPDGYKENIEEFEKYTVVSLLMHVAKEHPSELREKHKITTRENGMKVEDISFKQCLVEFIPYFVPFFLAGPFLLKYILK